MKRDKKDAIIELGNELLRKYCPEIPYPVTRISKWTIRDYLITHINERWQVGIGNIPSEETFYKTFRSGTASSAMCEKMAILYFGITFDSISNEVKKDYLNIANRQRVQSYPYWNKFLERRAFPIKHYPSLTATQNSFSNIPIEKMQLLESVQKQRKNSPVNHRLLNKVTALEQNLEFDKAESMIQETIEADELTLAWKYINKGIYMELQNRFEEAFGLYKRAIALKPTNAVFYHQLGTLQELMGDYEASLKTHTKGLRLNEKQFGEPHRETGVSHNNLFSVWVNLGNLKNAENAILKARDNMLRTVPEKSQEKIALYQNLGLLYENVGDIANSIQHRRKGVELSEQLYGTDSETTAKAYHNLGVSLSLNKEIDEAITWFEKALKVETKVLGYYNYTTAQTLNSIGFMWLTKKEYSSALFCFKSSLDVVQQIFPYPHGEIGLRHNNIGLAYIHLKNYEEAEARIREALKIYSKTFNPESIRFGICYDNLALLNFTKGDYGKAKKFCQKGLSYYKKLKPNHSLVIRANQLMASILSENPNKKISRE